MALCFLLGVDLNQNILEMVCGVGGGTFQEVLKEVLQGTLKGQTELHLSYFRDPCAGRHLERPLSPFLYGKGKQFMGVNLTLSDLFIILSLT